MEEIPRTTHFKMAKTPEQLDKWVMMIDSILMVACLILIFCICRCLNTFRGQIASGQINAGFICTVQIGQPDFVEVQPRRLQGSYMRPSDSDDPL
jgi:hypothetical protein